APRGPDTVDDWASKRWPPSPSADDPIPQRPPSPPPPATDAPPVRPVVPPPPPIDGPRPRPVIPYEEPTYKAPAAFSSSARPSAESSSAHRPAPKSGERPERRTTAAPPPPSEPARTGVPRSAIIGGFVAVTLAAIFMVSRIVKPAAPVNTDPPLPTA